tara:strand:- start:202 stop:390 length:189 start_codon:yes stop_codon:yes gene_type:complete
VTDLEDKVLMLKMRLSKFRKDHEEILKETEEDKAVLIFDNDDPHLLRKNEQHRNKSDNIVSL